ncbi:MAG: twin-arginine translocase TatA/TatE family subunit [Puniceicoccales bacterium]|jgi:sec-independent protein translocase protein TatA|nr:twin-arginine translocase TatA/TatE family subunit [Puniceicoccales bacterium]
MSTPATFAFITDMNPGTIVLIVLVVVLLFGGSKLPELARGLGKARREFKRASDEIEDEVRTAMDEEERKKEKEKQDEIRRKKIEEEERAKIREKIESEERAKIASKSPENPE